MHNITADELAERWDSARGGDESDTVFIALWIQANREHIIAALREKEERNGEMAQYLTDAREFSLRTFGPGKRTGGCIAHIRKELVEIEADPTDLAEWIDVAILAADGYWRHGGDPAEYVARMRAKLEINKLRKWPAPGPEDVAMEHDRTHDDPLNPELGPEHREFWIRKAEAGNA